MCGIAGIVNKKGTGLLLPHLIKQMTGSIKHRGPDDEGFVLINKDKCQTAGSGDTQNSAWNASFVYCPVKHIDQVDEDFTLALGHRRLSIIDLTEAGHQPMCDSTRKIWVVCNGEMYNYIELRDELVSKGHVFHTQSDIEVLLKAYQHYGIDCLEKLNGMWSFVIYDAQQNILFGSRDRFGVKPMYYYKDSDYFAFASEQKSLFTLPFVPKEINRPAVFEHLLSARIELHEEGFFKNIFELSPAHYFIYNLNDHRFDVKSYFSLRYENLSTSFHPETCKKYSDKLREHLFRAVDIRLRSDVPVGFCLSGGLDSSAIISIASLLNNDKKLEQLTDRITAFTATTGFDDSDESKWAQKVVEKNNLRWIKAECKAENIMDDLEAIIYYQDIPLSSTSTYAQNKVMQSAKENGIKILLDGQGGDELFAGYPAFYTSYYLELLKKLRFGSLFSEWKHIKNSPTSAGIFIRSLFKIGLDSLIPSIAVTSVAKIYKHELNYFEKNFIKENTAQINFSNDFIPKPLNATLQKYCTDYYLKNLLRWEDRCSMQYSIESRTPFSDDPDLINFIFSIPSVYKIHKGWSKYLLRETMKEIIPEDTRLRKDKLGFSTPQQSWLFRINEQMKAYVSDLGKNDEIIKHELLLKNWDTIFNDAKYAKVQDFVWRYVCFLIWKKIFF